MSQANPNNYRKYVVGNGLHLINDRGDDSTLAILHLMEYVLIMIGAQVNIMDLWNRVYPERPRSMEEMAAVVMEGVLWTEPPTLSHDDLLLLVEDARLVGYGKLADAFETILREHKYIK